MEKRTLTVTINPDWRTAPPRPLPSLASMNSKSSRRWPALQGMKTDEVCFRLIHLEYSTVVRYLPDPVDCLSLFVCDHVITAD